MCSFVVLFLARAEKRKHAQISTWNTGGKFKNMLISVDNKEKIIWNLAEFACKFVVFSMYNNAVSIRIEAPSQIEENLEINK